MESGDHTTNSVVERGYAAIACLLSLMLLAPLPALGADKLWFPTGAGSWFTGTNWRPSFGVPGASDVAQINNGGTANADTTTGHVVSDRIEIGKNGTTGSMTVGGATSRNVTIGSDWDIGQTDATYATGAVNVTSNGSVTISNALNVRVGNSGAGDIDVASAGTGTGATANSTGMLTVQNSTLLDVFDDLDVGQASAAASSTAASNSTVSISNVGTVDIGGDFDIGQAGGLGRATAVGTATVGPVTTMLVGVSLVAGRTNGSAGLGNSGGGTVMISDTTLSVGFGSASLPGDIDIGDAIVSGTQRATAFGSVTLQRVTTNVKRRVNIGDLSGGGTNTATTTDGTLSLINSKLTTVDLDIARVVGTAGTAKGKLSLDASLVNVTGAMTLGEGSELVFALRGTTRATGTTASGQYGALNAGTALLNGKLTVQLAGGFLPSAGNQFQVISATTASGAFDLVTLPTLSSGLAWNVTTNSSGVLLAVGLATLPGDFNADGKVNAADYVVWRKTGGSMVAYNTWRANFTPGVLALPGDFNTDGKVNAADYVVWRKNNGTTANYNTWRANFGRMSSGSGGGSAQTVPEASAAALVVGLLPLSLIGRPARATVV